MKKGFILAALMLMSVVFISCEDKTTKVEETTVDTTAVETVDSVETTTTVIVEADTLTQ